MKNGMKGGNSLAFLSHEIEDLEHSKQVNLPRVTVVIPLKGFGEHNLHNWRSQITTLYGGAVEFLFMVESTEDPAYRAVSKLLKDFEDEVDAKVIVAGHSTTCNQKIHNQLIGAEEMHKDSNYILFLDDNDVRLHPGTIGALTAKMEKIPRFSFKQDILLTCLLEAWEVTVSTSITCLAQWGLLLVGEHSFYGEDA